MFSFEIFKILSRNCYSKQYFVGCFAADQIPIIHYFPHCMIVNLDPSYMEGSHWIAIFVNSLNSVEYYDSLGEWPSLALSIQDFLESFNKIRYNSLPIQSENSESCGRHAIFFLILRCKGFNFDFIIQTLKKQKSSDRFVINFVKRVQSI